MLLRIRDLDMKSDEIDLKSRPRTAGSGIYFSAPNAAFLSSRLQKNAKLTLNRRKILQLLSIDLFEKTPILSRFSHISGNFGAAIPCTQLKSFNLCWDSTDLKSEISDALAVVGRFAFAATFSATSTAVQILQPQGKTELMP